MRILADENIPFVVDAFRDLGEVTLLAGSRISREALAGVECLLVRSVTRVDRELLDGSSVRFVATATAGVDHVDQEYLEQAGIGFAGAPGSNATSVAEYVMASLLCWASSSGTALAGRSIGVIGAGQVGSRVASRAEALGMRVILNDPPLREESGDPKFRDLDEALGADFVTLHVPLEKQGRFPTCHLADAGFFERMRPGSIFINAARGAVHDTAALSAALASGRLAAAILDVWENEPIPDATLLEQCFIATPHIAGYSLDGKVRGTEMILAGACDFFGKQAGWKVGDSLKPPADARLMASGMSGGSLESVVWDIVRQAYDPTADDARFRGILEVGPEERGRFFSNLRRSYPVRREFACYSPKNAGLNAREKTALANLGFRRRNN